MSKQFSPTTAAMEEAIAAVFSLSYEAEKIEELKTSGCGCNYRTQPRKHNGQ
ncbi:hypothetical protein [Leptothermofonsia sp. ETS-13]|uniref:hypothetical protein n=1 Tax=Leptothermofonsia sp. ETS-13 TaxID=3035696 RepID=UPI003B9E139D